MPTSPKSEQPFLTRAESELMQALWDRGPQTVAQLLQHVERDVAYTTALTLVRILEQKGYVTHEPNPEGGRAHLYKAAIPPERVRKRHVKDLVDRLFGGRAHGLVVGLLDDDDLGPDELAALRQRIDEKLSHKRGKR